MMTFTDSVRFWADVRTHLVYAGQPEPTLDEIETQDRIRLRRLDLGAGRQWCALDAAGAIYDERCRKAAGTMVAEPTVEGSGATRHRRSVLRGE
jgi:hypothetical protein